MAKWNINLCSPFIHELITIAPQKLNDEYNNDSYELGHSDSSDYNSESGNFSFSLTTYTS